MQKEEKKQSYLKQILKAIFNWIKDMAIKISIRVNKIITLLWEIRINVILLLFLYYFYWFSNQGMDVIIGLTEYDSIKSLRLFWSYIDIFFFAFFQWYLPRFILKINYADEKNLYKEEWIGATIKRAYQDLFNWGKESSAATYSFTKSVDVPKFEGDLEYKVRKFLPRVIAVLSILIASTGTFKLAVSSLEDYKDAGEPLLFWMHQPLTLTILLIGLSIAIVHLMDKVVNKYKDRNNSVIITSIFLLLIFLCMSLISDLTVIRHHYRLFILSGSQVLLALLFCYFVAVRRCLQTRDKRERVSRWIHITFSIAMGSMLIFYAFLNINEQLTNIYPITVIYNCLSFFGLSVALLMYFGQKSNIQYLTIVLIFLMIGAWVNNSFYNLKLHELDYVESNSTNRMSLDNYFGAWLEQRRDSILNYPDKKYPIYIVAGEGGGSRAAFWTNSVLSKLHDNTNGKFTDHCLAITSVSGSSFGVATHLAFLNKHKNNLETKTVLEQRTIAFTQNYLSSSLASMLGRDFWITTIPYLHYLFDVKDRAKRLESEWTYFVERSIGNGPDHRAEKIFQQPFCKIWEKKDYKIPLFLSNSTNVENGKRGIISPVKLNEQYFVDAIDILDSIKGPKTIKLCTGTLLSARFPYINPGGEIEGVGHFVDGGYYENSAAQTAEAIWKTCNNFKPSSKIDQALLDKISFRIILVFNGSNSYLPNRKKSPKGNLNQLLIPPIGIFKIRSGHTQYAYKRLIKELEVDPNSHYSVFELDHNVLIKQNNEDPNEEGYRVIMPLARFLSKRAAQGITKNLDDGEIPKLKKIKRNLQNLKEIEVELTR